MSEPYGNVNLWLRASHLDSQGLSLAAISKRLRVREELVSRTLLYGYVPSNDESLAAVAQEIYEEGLDLKGVVDRMHAMGAIPAADTKALYYIYRLLATS